MRTTAPQTATRLDPNINPNIKPPASVAPSDASLNQWFNGTAFHANALGTFGNSGRNNIHGPGALTFDMAVMRRFAITGRHRLEAWAEGFNILKSPGL